ncbi:MAG: Hsp70 family protein, partial [Trueperaceae bacterium]|nr:Hsp70 family protein [Trueperaceae bacterium]
KSHAEEDRKARELAEAKNQLDGLKLQARKTLDEATGASDDDKKPVEDAINAAQQALDSGSDKDALEARGRELAEMLQAFMQANAQQSSGGSDAGAADGPTGPSDDDDVVDAEFKPAS